MIVDMQYNNKKSDTGKKFLQQRDGVGREAGSKLCQRSNCSKNEEKKLFLCDGNRRFSDKQHENILQ